MKRSTLVLLTTAVITGATWTKAAAADDTCRSGYVWREAFAGDRVCVTPPTRDQAARDNNQAAARREPGGGPYGPDTCRSGYVWRAAGANDRVCVTPETRDRTAHDNTQAAARRAAAQPPAGSPPAGGYNLSDWSGWSRGPGIEYRYRWGWNPQDSRYATRVDAIFQMKNRQPQRWEGAARSVDCDRDVVSMGTNVVLQANETKEVKFMTPNCGTRTNPSFRPNVVKAGRID